MYVPCRSTELSISLRLRNPKWGIADAEINVPSAGREPRAVEGSLFKACGRLEYSLACLDGFYCKEFCLSNSTSFSPNFFQYRVTRTIKSDTDL